MDKYIITNCPSCRDFDVFGLPNKGCCYNFNDYCSRHNECALKQIVELCNKIISRNGNINFKEGFSNLAVGENFVARQILKLLDIQEVE